MFQAMESGCVHTTTEKYAGGKKSHFVMEEHKILRGGDDGKDIDYSIHVDSENVQTDRHYVLTEQDMEGVDNAYGLRTWDVVIRSLAETIAEGPENLFPRRDAKEKFSRRASIGISPYTGAAVKFMSTIQFWDRSFMLDCKEDFLGAQAKIELEEEEGDEVREQRRSIFWYGNRSISKIPSDKQMEGMDGNVTVAIHSCSKCMKKTRYASSVDEHEDPCSGIVFTQQSTVERAAEIASRLVYG